MISWGVKRLPNQGSTSAQVSGGRANAGISAAISVPKKTWAKVFRVLTNQSGRVARNCFIALLPFYYFKTPIDVLHMLLYSRNSFREHFSVSVM